MSDGSNKSEGVVLATPENQTEPCMTQEPEKTRNVDPTLTCHSSWIAAKEKRRKKGK